MNDVVKGAVAILVFIVVAGIALAFMKPSEQGSPPSVTAQPDASQLADAARTARRDKLRSDCLGPNAEMMPPRYFREALDACDKEVSREMAMDPDPATAEEMAEAYDAAVQKEQRARLAEDQASAVPSPDPAPIDSGGSGPPTS